LSILKKQRSRKSFDEKLDTKSPNTKLQYKKAIANFEKFCSAKYKNRIADNDFVDKIVDTRDYHVHGDGQPRDNLVTDSRELFGMIHDMISLIEIFLMSQIGINEICKNQVYQKNKTQYVI